MKAETLSTQMIYKGKIFDIHVDDIREGEIGYKRDVVVHPGSAVVVPVFDNGTVGFVRQYRHAAGKYLLEIPAGSLEGDEDPELGALRELEEEIGFRAGKIEKLSEFYVSPGFLTEKMYVFLATELTESNQNLDDDEIVEIVRIPFAEALGLIRTGEIEDAKTMVGLMMAFDYLQMRETRL